MALPTHWPASVYGLEIGIVGTDGVIDIEDTHRDVILASSKPQGAGYSPKGFTPESARYVDFLTSYPPGDVHMGQLWGPMREETNVWFGRLYTGMATPHATPRDGHRNLVLTKAMDLLARRGAPGSCPSTSPNWARGDGSRCRERRPHPLRPRTRGAEREWKAGDAASAVSLQTITAISHAPHPEEPATRGRLEG